MYHFGSNEAFQSQGGAFGDPSLAPATVNYADMIFAGGSSSSSNSSNLEEKLKLLGFSSHGGVIHQAIHDSSMGGPDHCVDPKHLQMQQCFDPNSSVLDILNAADHHTFHSHGTGMVFGEMPAEINSTMFYDHAAMGMDLSNQAPSVLRNMLSSLENGSGLMMNHGLENEGYGGHTDMIKLQGGVKRKKRSSVQRDEELDEAGSQKNEKQRRERFTKKFDYLRSLIPNTTKPDRASVIADTIDYINELLRTIKELKILVEKKRLKMARNRRMVAGDQVEAAGDMESSSVLPLVDDVGAGRGSKMQLRSSWLQRKTRETFVDVRIVEDEVYIKLTQRRKINCLLLLSKVLDDLHLDLLYLSFGNIGDSHIFMLDTKIHEGSSVYASAVAKKLIEVMDVSSSNF